jgi:membrane protein implicated in regulation of membrane protease activity
MNWWGWVICGAILFAAELGLVNAQFYLVFVGSAAIIVGLITALRPGLAVWAQWASFALLALLSMVTFRSRLYRWMRGHPPAVASGPAGGVLTLPTALDPGQTCQAEHGGTFWTVRNDGHAVLPAGTRARIARVDGLTLLVRPEHWTG